jgi:putative transcriptional regulator
MRNRIRVMRAERRWSQAELAERLGVSRQTVNAVENERYDPSLPLAFRISRAFGVPIEVVFQFDDEDEARAAEA